MYAKNKLLAILSLAGALVLGASSAFADCTHFSKTAYDPNSGRFVTVSVITCTIEHGPGDVETFSDILYYDGVNVIQ